MFHGRFSYQIGRKGIESDIEGHEMKTNGIPAIIMLTAGFVDCVIAIYTHASLWNFTRQLLLVLIIFYVIGCVAKVILDRNFKDMGQEEDKTAQQDTEDTEPEGTEEQEKTEGEPQENAEDETPDVSAEKTEEDK